MADAKDFGTKLKELETITEWFESDEVDLNTALGKFERGMVLADELKKELGEIENRVEVIKRKFDVAAPAHDGPSEPPADSGGSEASLF
jgi:exodeoxyribonuclease VII small subunit